MQQANCKALHGVFRTTALHAMRNWASPAGEARSTAAKLVAPPDGMVACHLNLPDWSVYRLILKPSGSLMWCSGSSEGVANVFWV